MARWRAASCLRNTLELSPQSECGCSLCAALCSVCAVKCVVSVMHSRCACWPAFFLPASRLLSVRVAARIYSAAQWLPLLPPPSSNRATVAAAPSSLQGPAHHLQVTSLWPALPPPSTPWVHPVVAFLRMCCRVKVDTYSKSKYLSVIQQTGGWDWFQVGHKRRLALLGSSGLSSGGSRYRQSVQVGAAACSGLPTDGRLGAGPDAVFRM